MSQQSFEGRYKAAVKKAVEVVGDALRASGVGGNLISQLTSALVPDLISHYLNPGDPQGQAIAPVTSIPPIQSSSLSSPSGLFDEFKKRLPAELRSLLRVKDHNGTEILIVSSEKLVSADFAAVCRVAEELHGKWISAGRDSAWHLPLLFKQPEKK